MSEKTTKSFKTTARDKPKHSAGGAGLGLRKGGHGGWGKPEDDYDQTLDFDAENDPNYDPTEHAQNYYLAPSVTTTKTFNTTILELGRFKKEAVTATKEYVLSHEFPAFQEAIEELAQPLYHQELPKIVIRYALEKDDEVRTVISTLLAQLSESSMCSNAHFANSFRKLYATLDDIIVDAPRARTLLKEFGDHAVSNGFLEEKELASLQQEAELLSDRKTVDGLKAQIKTLVREYLSAGDVEGSAESFKALNASYMHFEIAKTMINTAMDQTDTERKLCSEFLCSPLLKEQDVVKAFTILLARVEDLYLDVPDVLSLLSWFLARAISDEVVPPSYLLRVDLGEQDMGYQITRHTLKILSEKNAADLIQNVWQLPKRYFQAKKDEGEEEQKQE